ncbi:MAG: hypothetical protein K6F53_08265 [Lachnospiraceae bacterium]|nr:hypothetical protein [Lachnospiraceae bacterium]
MMGMIVMLIAMVALFKVTGFCLKICGKLMGAVFSFAGYLLLATLGVTIFGLALAVIPIILVVGILTIVTAAVAV